MRKKAKWLLSTVLAVAMIVSCLPVSSMAAYNPLSEGSNSYGINIDLSGVPKQVQQAVAGMIAQGEKAMSKQIDKNLAKAVEKACGISLEAVKTCLALGLMTGTDGSIDTSRFNLTKAQFDKVMNELLSEYYLSGLEYQCEITDGRVVAIYFTPQAEASQPATTALAPRGEDADSSAESTTDTGDGEETDSSAESPTDTEDSEDTNSGDESTTDTGDGEDTDSSDENTTYTAEFNWKRSDVYVAPTEEEEEQGAYTEVNGTKVAYTLVYNEETKEVEYGLKTAIDYVLESVTLRPNDGGDPITVAPTEENCTVTHMYSFYGYELPSREYVDSQFGAGTGDMASDIEYYTVTYDGVTYGDGPGTDKGVDALGRLDVTSLAMQIHWNQMLTFTRDYAQYFGAAGDFWTSKNTEQTPYGAFKTQLDSYPEDYMPETVMDNYMELMTLAYMSYVSSYANLLDEKIADCMAQITDSMTDVQKFLVIHDWLANNAQFDMGILVKTVDGTGAPEPAQMTAFGALLSDAMGYDGCICLGYSAAYAVLVQHAFPEIYQNEDKTWKAAGEVGNDDIVDLVQIRFYVDLADISVAGADSGFGKEDEMFSSVHYFNAVKSRQTGEWYYIDSAYDDISTEVMDQCRVETNGNLSHKYFMISPVNMLDMFEDSMDYIDSLYDGVIFARELVQNEDGSYAYKTETDKYGKEHVIWNRSDTNSETASDDDQYEATWFSGATSEITNDGSYWYYVTGPSYSYASMIEMQDQMGDSGMDISSLFDSDDPEYADRLVRRPMDAKDEPDESSSSSGGGMAGMSGMDTYDDPYDETLFHFGYGSVGDSEENGEYYDQIVIDDTYHDMYPDLAHTMGLYKGVIYFNLGNKIYTMKGATGESLDNVTVTQLKEYNDVYANSDGRDFTGMSFYMDEESDDNAFHVFNRPIAAISIEDQVDYNPVIENGEVVGLERVGSTPTMTVSIATNYSESYKTDEGESYKLEAVDYNVDYSKYTDDGSDENVNNNEEFMWCANVVDTMPMDDMLSEVGSNNIVDVTVDAWCGQDGYTEARTATYGLSDGTAKITDADEDGEKDDQALNHHYIENAREECYICVHCNDAYHAYPEDDENYEELPEGATIGHIDEGATEVVDLVWSDDGSSCTGLLLCAEPHCDAVVGEDRVDCDVTFEATTFATKDAPGTKTCIASYNGNEVGRLENVEVAFMLGDVNGDGEVDIMDIIRLRQLVANWEVEANKITADVNEDSELDLADVILLRQYVAGWEVTLGAAE